MRNAAPPSKRLQSSGSGDSALAHRVAIAASLSEGRRRRRGRRARCRAAPAGRRRGSRARRSSPSRWPCRLGAWRMRSVTTGASYSRWMRPSSSFRGCARSRRSARSGAHGPVRQLAGQYSDNPRAISEELHRREAGPRHVWVLDPGAEVPDGRAGRPATAAHLALMGRARYIVANGTVPGFHLKRRARTLPDLARHAAEADRLRHRADRARGPETAKTSAATSRSGTSWSRRTRSAPRSSVSAFAYAGRCGDRLSAQRRARSPEAGGDPRRGCASAGHPGPQRAVLYAPNRWRDDATRSTLMLDCAALGAELGPIHVSCCCAAPARRGHAVGGRSGDPQLRGRVHRIRTSASSSWPPTCW